MSFLKNMLRKLLIFSIIPLLLIVPSVALAVDYEYNGYTPKWAIPLDDDQALNMCSYITSPGDEKKWCDSFGLYLTELWKLTQKDNEKSSETSTTIDSSIMNSIPFNKIIRLNDYNVKLQLPKYTENISAKFDESYNRITFQIDITDGGTFVVAIPDDFLNTVQLCESQDLSVFIGGVPKKVSQTHIENFHIIKIPLTILDGKQHFLNSNGDTIVWDSRGNNIGFLVDVRVKGTHFGKTVEEILERECPRAVEDDSNPFWMTVSDKSDLSGIHIKSLNDYVDSLGYFHIIGEVVNNSDKTYEFNRLDGTIYDENERSLDSEFTYTLVDSIPPYSKSPFNIVFVGGSLGVDSFEVQLSGAETTEKPRKLTITKPSIFVDSIDNLHLVGEVMNLGEQTANFVKVVATFYNSNGEVVGQSFTYTKNSDIYPGQYSTYEIVENLFSEKATSYQLYVFSKEYDMMFSNPKYVLEKSEKTSTSSLEIEKKTDEIITTNSESENKSQGGGCLIATATFDSELAPQVQKLREIRDSKLLQTESGSQFMEHFNSFYYSFSPYIADYERENPVFKEIVKIGITPMISTLSLMDYADTESEVLGIGISLIILNAMMYVGLPVFGIMRIRK